MRHCREWRLAGGASVYREWHYRKLLEALPVEVQMYAAKLFGTPTATSHALACFFLLHDWNPFRLLVQNSGTASFSR